MGRWIGDKIPSLVHVIQKICDGDWFLLAEKGEINRSEHGRQADGRAHIRVGKRRREVDRARGSTGILCEIGDLTRHDRGRILRGRGESKCEQRRGNRETGPVHEVTFLLHPVKTRQFNVAATGGADLSIRRFFRHGLQHRVQFRSSKYAPVSDHCVYFLGVGDVFERVLIKEDQVRGLARFDCTKFI